MSTTNDDPTAAVTSDHTKAHPPDRAPLVLEEKFYKLSENEYEFYKSQTGIDDPEALKKHILQVQAEAYAVWPYHCIRRFSFTALKISRYPAYKDLLQLGRERKGALFLDLGCCFGNDVRKAVVDGFPVEQAIASDLRPEFWDLGHKLFKSTPESFPATFFPGNIFDSEFLTPAPLAFSVPSSLPPSLKDLHTLTPLTGRLSAIHTSAFFHLFNEVQQLDLAKRLASLLSPEPGSFIFGSHRGLPVKGPDTHRELRRDTMSHSPETWKEMWEKDVFQPGQVKVWAILMEHERADLEHLPPRKYYLLVWSVTRL